MVLGISRRDREASRADKVWKSIWLRQMLNYQRGLTTETNNAITIDTNKPMEKRHDTHSKLSK